jgi:O-antigen biosynthesis protein WbqP
MKRVFDLLISAAVIPVAMPLCLIAAVVIWLECRASPFFLQTRLGRHERPFRLLKLRTMSVGTVEAASHEVGSQHILNSGRIARSSKIDELPQLLNVLKGDMSLVGPRPGLPVQGELTRARREYGVFEMLPGISGVSQIAGFDMSSPWELAKLDASYKGRWSLRRDFGILFRTILGKGSGDAASNHAANKNDTLQ